jgi:hypothetical protein
VSDHEFLFEPSGSGSEPIEERRRVFGKKLKMMADRMLPKPEPLVRFGRRKVPPSPGLMKQR